MTSRATLARDVVTVPVLLASIAVRGDGMAALGFAGIALLTAVVLAAASRGAVGARHHLVDLAVVALATIVAIPPVETAPLPTSGHGHEGAVDAVPALMGLAAVWLAARVALLRNGRERRSQLLTLVVAGMCLSVLLLAAVQPAEAASASVASATVAGATTSPSST